MTSFAWSAPRWCAPRATAARARSWSAVPPAGSRVSADRRLHRVPLSARRQSRRHRRRAGPRRHAASRAAGDDRRLRLAVRLLHARHRDGAGRSLRGAEATSARRGAHRQPLPLHRLLADPRVGGRGRRRRGAAARASSIPRRHARGAPRRRARRGAHRRARRAKLFLPTDLEAACRFKADHPGLPGGGGRHRRRGAAQQGRRRARRGARALDAASRGSPTPRSRTTSSTPAPAPPGRACSSSPADARARAGEDPRALRRAADPQRRDHRRQHRQRLADRRLAAVPLRHGRRARARGAGRARRVPIESFYRGYKKLDLCPAS